MKAKGVKWLLLSLSASAYDYGKILRNTCRNLNVNEEYNRALRKKSYADFFTKAQLLVNDQPSSPSYSSNQIFTEFLLEPGQETIAHILNSEIRSSKFNLKALIFDYFNMSADASNICSRILESINLLQSKFKFVQKIFDTIDDYSPHAQFGSITSELGSSVIFNNPFPSLTKQDFELIRDKYSSVLHNIKSKRRKVGRKMKMINSFNKAMSPAILCLPIRPLKKKIQNFHFLRIRFLKKVGEQLDVAAKGTYILNRDFDTMSRLVARLHDEFEHNKVMLQLCLERREEKISMQVLRELKKSAVGFWKQVEELEEHVRLCLVTINRARALVITGISTYRVEV